MKIVTVFLPEDYLGIMEKLVQQGRFPNRSEAIRVAVRDLIKTEFQISVKTGEVMSEEQPLLLPG
jgi:antitoxin ParD1/3/4